MPEKATIYRFKKFALPSHKPQARAAENEMAASVVGLITDSTQILTQNIFTR
jgi:hypothetical protein